MPWVKDKWICEDCSQTGEDWGVPEECPSCSSENVMPVVKEPA